MRKVFAGFLTLASVVSMFGFALGVQAEERLSGQEVKAKLIPLYVKHTYISSSTSVGENELYVGDEVPEAARGSAYYYGDSVTPGFNTPIPGRSMWYRVGYIFKEQISGTVPVQDSKGKTLGYVYSKEYLNTAPFYKYAEYSGPGKKFYNWDALWDSKTFTGPYIDLTKDKYTGMPYRSEPTVYGYVYKDLADVPQTTGAVERGSCTYDSNYKKLICSGLSAGKLCNTTRADVGSHTPPVAYLCNGEDKVQFGQSPICQQNVCETSEEESPKLSLSFAEIPSQIPAWTEGKIEVTNTGNVSLKKGHALAILKVGVSQEPTYINFPFTGSPDVPRKGSSGTSFVLKSPGTYYVYAVDLATGEPFSERKTIEATEPAAPVLSATSWNVDDPNTWPVMSVPSLPPSQKLLAKLDDNTWLDFGGSRDGGMFGGENGKNNVKLEASPAPGTYTATLILLNVYGGFEVIAQRPVMITVTKGAAPASQPSAPAATPAVTPAPATAPVQNPAPASLATTTPAAAPAPAPVIPASVTLSYDAKDTVTVGTSISFSSVASGSNLSKHGLEMSADNGANWSLVTTWMPQSGDRQSSNVLFSQLGTYKVRAYASGDGSNFVYSNVAAIAVGEPVVERVEAPVLSSAVWFADDQATWPVVSTPTVLTASQSIRVKDPVTGEHYYTQANGVNSRKITSSPSAGVRTLEAYVYDYARGAVVATRPIDVTVSLKQPAAQPQPATTSVVAPQTQATAQTQAQGAQTNLNQVQNQAPTIVVPAAAEAPLLSTTTWYSDDPSTWPTVSTPSALTANQSMRVKGPSGEHYYTQANGVNSRKITSSPSAGVTRLDAYVYDYVTGAIVASRSIDVNVLARPSQLVQPSLSNQQTVVPPSATLVYAAKDAVLTGTTISFSSVASGSNLTRHGLETSSNGGATWSVAAAWNPQPGVTQSGNVSFMQAGTHMVRAYVSNDSGATFVYSAPVTISVTNPAAVQTAASNPVAPTLSSTSWYSDDPSTWPTVSTPSALTANQSIRLKSSTGDQFFDRADGVNSGKITRSPAPGTYQVEAYVYDYSKSATVAVQAYTVTVSAKSIVQPAAQATAPAQSTPVSTPSAPKLSSTSWYSDDQSTWPTISTPSTLTSSQSMRFKSSTGDQFFDRADGVNSGKITRSPAPGTYQVEAYVYDYSKSATVAVQAYTVTVSTKPVVVIPPPSVTVLAPSNTVTQGSSMQIWSTLSGANAIRHGLERSTGSGDWSNIASWNPQNGVQQGGSIPFPNLGTYQIRAYASNDAVNYVYSNPITVTVQPQTLTAPQLTKTTWYANDQSSWPSLFTPSTLSSGQSMRLKSLTGEQFFDRADGASFRKISRSPAPGSYQMEAYIYDYSKSATVVVRSISVTVLDAPAPSSDPASADQTNAAAGSNSASVMFSGDALQKLIRALQ